MKSRKSSSLVSILLMLVLVLSTLTQTKFAPIQSVEASPGPGGYDSHPAAHDTNIATYTPGHTAELARDSNLNTYAEFNYETPPNNSYLELKTFSTAPAGGTIRRVDFKMKYAATASTGGTYAIEYYVSSSGPVTLVADTTAAHTIPEAGYDTWADKSDPSGGGWSWADIINIRFRIRTTRKAGGTGIFQAYEAWVTVFSGAANVTFVYQSNVTDLTLTPKTTATLKPDGDGAYTDWTPVGPGTYHYERIDDWPTHDGDTSYIKATSDGLQERVTLQNHGTEDWPIAAVRVSVVARTTSSLSNEKISPIIFVTGWAYEEWGKSYVPTTTYTKYTSEWAKNPKTKSYWTWSDIDNLQAGVVSEADGAWAGEMCVTQLYVEVLGPRLSVEIWVCYVQNLWLYEFEMNYNPDVIQGVYIDQGLGDSVEVGPFLGSAGATQAQIKRIPGPWNNTLGKLSLSGAWLDTTDPNKLPDGTGQLSTVVFWVVGKGETNLRLGEDTGLAGAPPPTPNIIAKGREHVEDGYFRNINRSLMPTASFSITPVGTPVPLEGYDTTFTSTSTAAPGKSLATYKWYFWEIYLERLFWPIASTSTVTKNYTRRGTWNVTLVVTDNEGVVGTTTGYATIKAHDIYFTSIETNATIVTHPTTHAVDIGQTIKINVTAINEGHFTETFDVSTFWGIFYSGQYHYGDIGKYTGVTLAAGATTSLLFYWDTTGRNVTHPDTFVIHANASKVPYEWDTERGPGKIADNEFTSSDHRIRFHDVSITSLTKNATDVNSGDVVKIDVTVRNDGDYNETGITVTTYYDTTPIGSKIIHKFTNASFGIPPRFPVNNYTTTLTFLWNTLGVTPGSYIISASASTVPNEYDTSDNNYIDGTVRWAGWPTASFTFSPSKPLVGQTVTFNASSSSDPDGSIVTYSWNFGDSGTGSGVVAYHAYASHGTYMVTLTVTDNDGKTDSISKSVKVYAPPVASFNYSPLAPLVGQTVNFDAGGSSDADGTIVSYSWKFGDGATSTGVTVPHAYSTFGTYTVNLTVTDNDDFTNSITTSIKVYAPPVANFTYSPSAPLVGETVNFDASSSSDPDGSIASYSWNFGDGATGSGITPTHAYAAKGTYTVNLTVTDNDGLTNLISKEVRVRAPGEPFASFTYSPSKPVIGETVTFNASASFDDPPGYIVTYSWDFGDGTTGSGIVAYHAYATHGTYNVNLTVTDNDGLKDSVVQSVKIYATPVASFTHTPAKPLVGQTITFDASGSTDADGTIVGYAWDFGDGGTGNGPIVTHAYATAGNYNVKLTVTDDDDLTGTLTKPVKAHLLPVALFTYSPSKPGVGESTSFDASTSSDPDGSIASYSWNFGDGNITTVATSIITHVYAVKGTYTVNLTVTDNDGLKASTAQSVKVYAPPVASFTFAPNKPVVGEAVTFNAEGSSDSDGTIVSYSWDFGDGSTGSGIAIQHSYTSSGDYTVKLTVVDNDGKSNTQSQLLKIYVALFAPTASFTYSPSQPVAGKLVTFNSTSTDQDGHIDGWAWDLNGDGTVDATTENTTWTYTTPGNYTVRLTVTDNDGLTDTAEETVTIAAVVHDITVQSIAASPSPVTVGSSVTISVTVLNNGNVEETFNVKVSYDTTQIDTRSVTLAPAATTTLNFTWGTSGLTTKTYTLKAEAIVTGDAHTDDNSKTTTIAVNPVSQAPTASFTYSPSSPVAGQTITFDASGSSDPDGSITSYAWTFGDGSTGTGVTATHAYTAAGTYTVGLTVTDNSSLTDTFEVSVTVGAAPPSEGLPIWVIGIAAVALVGVVLAVIFFMRKKS